MIHFSTACNKNSGWMPYELMLSNCCFDCKCNIYFGKTLNGLNKVGQKTFGKVDPAGH